MDERGARGAAGLSGTILLLWVWGVFREILSLVADIGSAASTFNAIQPIVTALWFKLLISVIGVALIGYWARGSKREILSKAERSKAMEVWTGSFLAATSAVMQTLTVVHPPNVRPDVWDHWPSQEALYEFYRGLGHRATLLRDLVVCCGRDPRLEEHIDLNKKHLLECYRRLVELATWNELLETIWTGDLSKSYLQVNVRNTMHKLEPELQAVLVDENLSSIRLSVRTATEKAFRKAHLPPQ